MGVFSYSRLPCPPFVLLAGLVLFESVASAGLLVIPPSYVVASQGEQYVLVMICPEYSPSYLDGTSQSEYDEAELPDGQTVNLRNEFPESGLYHLESKKLIWRTGFYVRPESVTISDDGQHWVFCNWVGLDDDFKNWTLRFFGPSGEIKSYSGIDLIDLPFLLERTSSGYYWDWVDREWDNKEWKNKNDPAIRDGVFYLNVMTRETYEFDITTGNILSETHFWKPLARWGLVLLTVLLGLLAWGIHRYGCWRRKYLAAMPIPSNDAARKTFFSFSLRQLLGVMTVVATACCIYRYAPFALPLIVALGTTITLGYRLFFAMKECRWYFQPMRSSVLTIGFFMLLLTTYVLSAGPVFAIINEYGIASDIRTAILYSVYYPQLWLFVISGIGSDFCEPILDYLQANGTEWEQFFRERQK